MGKYSKKTRGLISLSTFAATTPYSISRNAWLARGTRVDEHPERGGPAEDGQGEDGPQHPQQRDAAGLEGDPFAVAREAAEGDEQAQQEGHRDRDGEGLGDQEHEHPQDDGRRDTPLARSAWRPRSMVLHHQHEGEDRERQEEGREDFAKRVAVEDAEHAAAATIAQTPRRRQRRVRRRE